MKSIKYFLLSIIVFFTSCLMKNEPNEVIEKKNTSIEWDSNFYKTLSGKNFNFCLGDIEKGKIITFIVTIENDVEKRQTIDSILIENNLLAKDSQELKSIVLIYEAKVFNTLYDEKIKDNEAALCFLDVKSNCIKYISRIKREAKYNEYENKIAQQIVNLLRTK
jgi:hypothetical protein